MYIVAVAVIVGVLIGALTNALAIKMLFRPFSPWRIGKWQVPFTPGLIPKRRDELAEQLGLLVEQYLLTASGVKQFLEKSNLKEQLLLKIKEKTEDFNARETTISQMLTSFFKHEYWKLSLQNIVESQIDVLYYKAKEMSLNQILTMEMQGALEQKLQSLTPKIIEGMRDYISSEQGKEQVNHALREFLEGKKMLGFFAGFLMEGNQFQDKIIEYIVQILNKPATEKMINDLIIQEWVQIKEKPLGSLLSDFNELVSQELNGKVKDIMVKIGEMKVSKLFAYLEDNDWLDRGYDLSIEFLLPRVERLLRYFPISQIVKNEVSQFSLTELEKMILSVVNKELKMITYFGGLLGGVIGLLQGLLYFFF